MAGEDDSGQWQGTDERGGFPGPQDLEGGGGGELLLSISVVYVLHASVFGRTLM